MYTAASLLFPAKETFLTVDEVEDSQEERSDEVGVEVEKKFGSGA